MQPSAPASLPAALWATLHPSWTPLPHTPPQLLSCLQGQGRGRHQGEVGSAPGALSRLAGVGSLCGSTQAWATRRLLSGSGHVTAPPPWLALGLCVHTHSDAVRPRAVPSYTHACLPWLFCLLESTNEAQVALGEGVSRAGPWGACGEGGGWAVKGSGLGSEPGARL